MKRLKYIGLTGSIACGKSTVASFFEEFGFYNIDADLLSREVMAPGGLAFDGVVGFFGKEILNNHGLIDRKILRNIVFNDFDKRQVLEGIVHPAIFEAERKRIGEIRGIDDKAVILTQAALMIEKGSYTRFDAVVVVYLDEKQQIERLMERDNIDRVEARKIIDSQLPQKEKLKYADFVVDNSRGLDFTRQDVKRVYDLIMQMNQGLKLSK